MAVTSVQSAIVKSLSRLPQTDRTFALMAAVVQDNPGAASACTALVQMAGRMASLLNATQREEVASAMQTEATRLVSEEVD